MSEKSKGELLKEQLFYKNESGVKDEKVVAAAELFCEGYKSFLNLAKTERESADFAVAAAIEKGFKKFGYILLKPFFKSPYKKAAKKYPLLEETVKQFISQQSRLEKEENPQLDALADPTATALSQILMLCSNDPIQKKVLNRLGYCLGRYIYLLDAGCDFEEDLKLQKFNVLKNDCRNMEEVRARLRPQIYFCINEASKAFELLEIKKYKDILGNIIYLGLEDTFKKELAI